MALISPSLPFVIPFSIFVAANFSPQLPLFGFFLSQKKKLFSPVSISERERKRERYREKEREREKGCRPLPKYFGRPFGSGIGP